MLYNLSMTNEEILEKQVETLEKLLQLKQAVIQELEAKVSRLQNPYGYGVIGGSQQYYGPGGGYPYGGMGGAGGGWQGGGSSGIVSFPSVWQSTMTCTDGQPHTVGTTNCCTKCGQQCYTSGGTATVQISGGGAGITTAGIATQGQAATSGTSFSQFLDSLTNEDINAGSNNVVAIAGSTRPDPKR